MGEQNRVARDAEERDLEERWQRSLRTIRAGLDPVPRRANIAVVEVLSSSSSSAWSTADISTESEHARLVNGPLQAAAESSSEEADLDQALEPDPQPRAKQGARQRAQAKARQRQRPRPLDRLALLRRVQQQRRIAQAAEREARRQARVQRVEERQERERRRRLGLPTRSTA